MAVYIENLQIEQFRGIQKLSIPHLNHINLVVGDNNCGKTSFLEALLLLRDPFDFTNTLRIARMRDTLTTYGGISVYEGLLTLFPHNFSSQEEMRMIALTACCNGRDISYSLQGKLQTIMLDPEEQQRLFRYSTRTFYQAKDAIPSECQAFLGELLVNTRDYQEEQAVSFHEYSTVSGRDIPNNRFLNIVYLSPFDHLQGRLFSRILTNESYKNLCVAILRLFDPGITDLLLLKNEATNRSVECVKHKNLGIMPLSTYGQYILGKPANGLGNRAIYQPAAS